MAKIVSKKWYQSKSLWINGLALVGGICSAIAGELAIGATLTIGSVANIILRIVTKLEIK